jgi:hypothetical protein
MIVVQLENHEVKISFPVQNSGQFCAEKWTIQANKLSYWANFFEFKPQKERKVA